MFRAGLLIGLLDSHLKCIAGPPTKLSGLSSSSGLSTSRADEVIRICRNVRGRTHTLIYTFPVRTIPKWLGEVRSESWKGHDGVEQWVRFVFLTYGRHWVLQNSWKTNSFNEESKTFVRAAHRNKYARKLWEWITNIFSSLAGIMNFFLKFPFINLCRICCSTNKFQEII